MKENDFMNINFMKYLKQHIYYRIFCISRTITPEGIVFSSQLREDSPAAVGIEKAQLQPEWDYEEQALLVVEYFLYKNSKVEIEKSNEFISKILRIRGEILGVNVGEKYRNLRGIQMQRENLSHFDPEYKGKLTGHESKWMEAIMDKYLHNPESVKRQAYEILKNIFS